MSGARDDTEAVAANVPRQPARTEWVYVIGAPGSPIVKIGHSADLSQRLRVIQTGSHVKVAILWQDSGGRALERALHREFRQLRQHGEWFDFGDADPVATVRDVTERLKAAGLPQVRARRSTPRTVSVVPPKLDPRGPAADDPDHDNPRYQQEECGCREMTPAECAARGYDPARHLCIYISQAHIGYPPCGGVH